MATIAGSDKGAIRAAAAALESYCVCVAGGLPTRYLRLGMTEAALPRLPPPPPRRPSWRDRLRTAGLIAVTIVSIVLRIVVWLAFQPEAEPPAAPPAERIGAYARTLPPGTCVVEPFPDGYVFPTSCDGRHGSEIVAMLTYPAEPGAPYPALPAFYGRALDLCRTTFEAYVGTPADQSPARFFVVRPSPNDWRAGERTFVCFAGSRSAAELTASVRARRP